MTPEYITIHCADTKPSMDIGVDDIRKWHLARGWSDVGYHLVIKRNGLLQPGRPLNKQGAHVGSHNRNNIGICLVGGMSEDGKPEDNFTNLQWDALRDLISELSGNYGIKEENILGHRDWPGTGKACPCFDVKQKLKEWGE